MPGPIQLLCCRESRRTRADNGDFFTRPDFGRLGTNEAFGETSLHDAVFNLLDGDRGLVDSQHARRLTRGWTNASGELGEIICRVKLAHGFFPAPVIHQIIPVWDEIVDRASAVAEGHAAIHAARALVSQLFFGEVLVNLEPVVHPLSHG